MRLGRMSTKRTKNVMKFKNQLIFVKPNFFKSLENRSLLTKKIYNTITKKSKDKPKNCLWLEKA